MLPKETLSKTKQIIIAEVFSFYDSLRWYVEWWHKCGFILDEKLDENSDREAILGRLRLNHVWCASMYLLEKTHLTRVTPSRLLNEFDNWIGWLSVTDAACDALNSSWPLYFSHFKHVAKYKWY